MFNTLFFDTQVFYELKSEDSQFILNVQIELLKLLFTYSLHQYILHYKVQRNGFLYYHKIESSENRRKIDY